MDATSTLTVEKAPARREVGARVLIGLQLYVVIDYVLTTIAPYLFFYAIPGKPIGGPHGSVWIVDALSTGDPANPLAWLFVAPGYFVTTMGGPISAMLALLAAATAASRWSELSPRTRTWLLASAALCVAYFFFGLTPLGKDLAIWIAD